MYKALVFKELRETAWIGLLAVAVYALVLAELMGYDVMQMRRTPVTEIPFQQLPDFTIFSIAAACGVLLGFRQSVWESLRGTMVFLLHRPTSRRALVCTKLAVGLVILLVATGLPLLIYALWSATPGSFAGPFYWSSTSPCWLIWFAMTIFYLAAFLAGIRPARWYGSRLFPLVGALVSVAITSGPHSFFALRWVAVIIADVVLLAAILRVVETRDYP